MKSWVGRKGVKIPLRDRFWEKVDKSGECWTWTAARRPDGYGIIRGDAPRGTPCNHKAHRVSWELANGPIPPGMFVCHRCDNPPCVRPDHLFLGTNAENLRDAARKGRMSRGEDRPLAKLTESSVRMIRSMCPTKVSYSEMARRLGVSSSIVWQAATRDTWKHV